VTFGGAGTAAAGPERGGASLAETTLTGVSIVGADAADAAPAIGVAIELPEPCRGELHRWRKRLGDPAADHIVPHITLVTPLVLPSAERALLVEHLQKVAESTAPFLVHLRGSASFRPVSDVVFVPLVAGREDCERLEQLVRTGPLLPEPRFPYHPHVTVVHDVSSAQLDRAGAELAGYDAHFLVTGFSLFEQGSGGHWFPAREFPFGSPGTATGPQRGGAGGAPRSAGGGPGR